VPHLAPFLLSFLPLQDWPNWRGPNHDGSSPERALPSELARDKGVRWAAELPGPSAGTPVILGERVFVSAAVEEAGLLLALCFERASGELLWEDQAGSGYGADKGSSTRRDPRSDYASPSPVTDGERVVFFFGNGDLVCYELAGKRLWAKNLQAEHGAFAFQWTFGASPTLWDGRLVLPVLQRDQPTDGNGSGDAAAKPIPSFLLALDAATGAVLYKEARASEARMESLESYATAIPFTGEQGRKELLVAGGDVITGHDPATGKELWRWGTWNEGHREPWWRLVPSPVVGGGRVLVCAPKKAPVYAVRLGGSGALDASAVAWQSAGRANPISSDVPTPLFLDGRFYVLSDVQGALSRVDPATGKADWTIELPGRSPWEASPTGADGKVYCLSHAGLALVVDAKSGAILSQAELGEPDDESIRSSIAIAHGALFLRTNTTLFCLGS